MDEGGRGDDRSGASSQTMSLPWVPERCLLCLLTTRRKPTLRKEVEVAQVWRYGSRKVATRV